MRSNKRFTWLILVLVASMVFGSLVTAQDDPIADVDPSDQTVVFWHQHTGAREEELLTLVDEFNEGNEWGITVDAQQQGGYGDIYEKMTAGIASGELPNLVVAYSNQAITYALAGALVDVNIYVYSPTWGLSEEDIADFFPAFLAADINALDGTRLGFPPNRSLEVVYYNADALGALFADGAIDFEGPPVTWDQFRAAACAYAETGDDRFGYEIRTDASNVAALAFSNGGDIFDYEEGVFIYDSPEAVAGIQFMQDLMNEGCATLIAERYGDQADFANQKVIFTMGSTSGLPYYRSAIEDSEAGPFDWSVAPLPYGDNEPALDLYGASVSIPVTTEEGQLAAWLFLEWYTGAEQQARWARASNYFPVRLSTAEGLAEYFEGNPQYETAFDFLQYAMVEPPIAGYDNIRNEARAAFNAVLDGDDVQDTFDDLNELANELMEDALAD